MDQQISEKKKARHTRGPWDVRVLDSDAPGWAGKFGIGQSGGYFIGQAKREEVSANARLISAAPELLEALELRGCHARECQSYKVVGRFGSTSGLRWQPNDIKTCSCGIGAAIAKARGES